MEFVVVDVETTGLSADKHEIIEIGAVRVIDGQITDTFQSLVKPVSSLPRGITELTGISSSMLKGAPPLAEVFPKFLEFIEGKPLAGHNIGFDLSFLSAACDELGYDLPTSSDVLDTAALARILLPSSSEHSLGALVDHFGIEVTDRHRAEADATATAILLTKLATLAEHALPLVTLQELTQLAATFSSLLATWFQARTEVRMKSRQDELEPGQRVLLQLAFQEDAADVVERNMDNEDEEVSEVPPGTIANVASDVLSGKTDLQNALPGFQIRAGQLKMVEEVSHAFESKKHLLVEAGTGTGKSLAYLIPSVLYAKATGDRVVVTTHTIALQDQIEQRDFPLLRTMMNDLHLQVMKGRNHYLCLRKLHMERQMLNFGTPENDVLVYMALLVFVATSERGMREEFSLSGRANEIWTRVQSESESCIHKRCPFFKPCFYFRARARAQAADVVVTNHSLLFSDLRSDNRVLPKYDRLIVDEAHRLEEVATKHLGEEVHWLQVLGLMNRMVRDHGKNGLIPELRGRISEELGMSASSHELVRVEEQLDSLRVIAEQVFTALATLIPAGQNERRITADVMKEPAWADVEHHLDNLSESMRTLGKFVERFSEYGESASSQDLSGRWLDLTGFLTDLLKKLTTLQFASVTDDGYVVWVERQFTGKRMHMSLYRAPIDVAARLRDELFAKKATVVLTSATLSVNESFDYAVLQMGLDAAKQEGKLGVLSVESPFDLQRQAILCVPSDVPDIASLPASESANWLGDSIYQLAKVDAGRMLVLFTSHGLLRATAEVLREPLSQLGIRVFAQGIDGPRSRLLSAFRDNERSVLLGAQSFWEGIDLPGDELTTLVIVRLPFAPPSHPVTEARHERLLQSGKSPFWLSSLPEAIVRFRQGFGRLIRTTSDRGVVVVYDKRLITAKYGKSFLKSISGVRPLISEEANVLDRVKHFLNQ